MHGYDEIGAPIARQIVSFDGGGRWQHDIGALRGGGEHRVLHDDRFGPHPRFLQAVDVLMMMIGVAAGPINQPHVGIVTHGAFIGELPAGIQKHVADARHRDEAVDGFGELRDGGRLADIYRRTHAAERGIAVAYPATRQTDLADHRG